MDGCGWLLAVKRKARGSVRNLATLSNVTVDGRPASIYVLTYRDSDRVERAVGTRALTAGPGTRASAHSTRPTDSCCTLFFCVYFHLNWTRNQIRDRRGAAGECSAARARMETVSTTKNKRDWAIWQSPAASSFGCVRARSARLAQFPHSFPTASLCDPATSVLHSLISRRVLWRRRAILGRLCVAGASAIRGRAVLRTGRAVLRRRRTILW